MKKSKILITAIVGGAVLLAGCTSNLTPASVSKNLSHNLNVLQSTVKNLDTINNSYLSNPDIYPVSNNNLKNLSLSLNSSVPIRTETKKIATLNLDNETNTNNELAETNNDKLNPNKTTNNFYYYDIKPIKYNPRYLQDISALENGDYLSNYISKVKTLYAITSDVIEANTALDNCKNYILNYVVEIKDLNKEIENGTFEPSNQQIAALNNYIGDIKTTIKRIKRCNGELSNEVNNINKTDSTGITTGIDVVKSNYLKVLNHLDIRITYLKNALTTLEQIKGILQEVQNIVDNNDIIENNNAENIDNIVNEDNNTNNENIINQDDINNKNQDSLNNDNVNNNSENINNNEIINNEDIINNEAKNNENIEQNLNDNNNENNIDSKQNEQESDVELDEENNENNSNKNIDTYESTINNLDTYNPQNNENCDNCDNTNINGDNNNQTLSPENNVNIEQNPALSDNIIENNNLANNNINNENNLVYGTDEDKINAPNGTFQNGIITQNNLNNGVNNGVNGFGTGNGTNYENLNNSYNNSPNKTNKNVDTYGYNTMIDMLNHGTVNNGINTLSVESSTKPSMVNSDGLNVPNVNDDYKIELLSNED